MNKEEILKIIKILKISYPSYFRELQDDEIVLMTQLWEKKFKNYSLDQVSNAIDNLTSKSKYMPSISEVLSEIVQINTPQLKLNPYGEWENVLKAIRKYGTYGEDKALQSLEEPTSTIARQLGWYRICTTERIEFEKIRFMEMFDYYNDIEKENIVTNRKQLPSKTNLLLDDDGFDDEFKEREEE